MLKDLVPRLTELGKIKIGRKEDRVRKTASGREWQAPQKLDHFLITTRERDSAGQLKVNQALMSRLLEKYGVEETVAGADGKPTVVRKLKEIPVAVLSDDVDDILVARYCFYAGRKLAAVCDGETCTYYMTKKGGDWSVLPTPDRKPCNGEHSGPGWKLHAKANFVIADGEARWGGVYCYRTTSSISASQLLGTMLQIKALTNGVLMGLPLRLVVSGLEVRPVVDGKEVASTVYVCHLELRGEDLNSLQKRALELLQTRTANFKALQEQTRQYRALLAAPEVEDDDEQADAAEEFHPGPENAREAPPAAEASKRKKSAKDEVVDVKASSSKPKDALDETFAKRSAEEQSRAEAPAPAPTPKAAADDYDSIPF